MWKFETQKLDGDTTKTVIKIGNTPLTYTYVLHSLDSSVEFRLAFINALKEAQFEAFFWETPYVSLKTIGRPFEYITTQAKDLAKIAPFVSPFSTHFEAQPEAPVLSFPNLGGDATLVVPAPFAPDHSCYGHLGAFVRRGPALQVQDFWQCAARKLKEELNHSPLWVSTAGLGVSWLHLRIDTSPKYYRHQPYKEVTKTVASLAL